MDFSKVLKVFYSSMLCCVCANLFADLPKEIPTCRNIFCNSKISFHINALFLNPDSNNLKYAVFVSGDQPLHQSWHNQAIKPNYSPAFEAGLLVGLPQSDYDISLDWLYLNTNDSDSKQASERVDPLTVEFVAPSYDVGPAVFGIKRADSTVNFNFNSVLLNVGRVFDYCPNVHVRIFGGVHVLRINQTLTTTFSDYAGSPPILTQAYGLPPDPLFNFKTQNTSRYLGAGPDLGINVQYKAFNGFGITGQFLGSLTAGSIRTNDAFTSTSSQLMAQGIAVSQQSITAPNRVQVVPGYDAKAGLFYNYCWCHFGDLMVEAGYRFAYYANAISVVNPGTLVQAELDTRQPEFVTGTMAINSTDARYSPFSLNGPYINLTLTLS